jgi:hypothetical protein
MVIKCILRELSKDIEYFREMKIQKELGSKPTKINLFTIYFFLSFLIDLICFLNNPHLNLLKILQFLRISALLNDSNNSFKPSLC